jgi:hypothetical protein
VPGNVRPCGPIAAVVLPVPPPLLLAPAVQ